MIGIRLITKLYSQNFGELKVKKSKEWAARYLARKLFHKYRTFRIKKAPTIIERTHDIIRQGITLQYQLVAKSSEIKAKEIICDVIRDYKGKDTFLKLGIKYWEQILKIRGRFLHIIVMKRERMEFLREMWESEKRHLIEAYEEDYNIKKSKKTKSMLTKLRNLTFGLRDVCLKLYLDKCRTEHNIAFFQWRQNFKIEAKELIDKYTMKLLRSIEKEENLLGDDAKEGTC